MNTSQERVVRNGRRIAFKGESMSVAEAERRGLLKRQSVSAPAAVEEVAQTDHSERTVAELKALLAERGIAYPKGARKPDLIALVSG
jgi:hypothetical protein